MNNEKYRLVRDITKIQNQLVASKIADSQKSRHRYDKDMVSTGIEYAKSGLTLEDATDEMRKNQNFIIGYEKGMRLLNVDDDFFARGAKAYFDGVNWENIADSDRENELFIQGYEDAMTMNTSKRR